MGVAELAASRLDWAAAQLAECRLCPRQCRANRAAGERGFCGAGAEARCFMDYVHYGEEAELVPSHSVFLTGCNLRCLFCHTAIERRTLPAETLTAARLRGIVERGRREGARNVSFHGGEPTVNAPALLRLFAALDALPPIVWNTNLYCTAETLEAIAGIPAFYLVDLKFGNAACAEAIAGAGDYWEVVRARLKETAAQEPGKLIVRHLVLPGHLDCCTRPALEWLARELPSARLSLKTDYLVMPDARGDARLGRFLTDAEVREATALARELGVPLAAQLDAGAMGALVGRESSEGQMLDAELVISPRGAVFLHHPTRDITSVALAISTKGESET
jgi:putative pyruvate formate lyase activating enzyme